MAEQLPDASTNPAVAAEIHPVQVLMRFLRAVRYRKGVIVVALVASGLLGGLYYATAPEVFESEAKLLIIPPPNPLRDDVSSERMTRELMETLKRVLTSEVVVKNAMARLAPEYQKHLEKIPAAKRVRTVQNSLTVTSVRNANVLELACQSIDAHLAKEILARLLEVFPEFMERSEQNTAVEIHNTLNEQKEKLKRELAAKEEEKRYLLGRSGEVAISDGEGVPVVIKGVVGSHAAWQAAKQRRIAAEAQSKTIREAVQRGEDLRQLVVTMGESPDGQHFLEWIIGVPSRDGNTQSRIVDKLIDDRTRLEGLRGREYGENHPRVVELRQRIALEESQLQQMRQDELAPLDRLDPEALAQKLLARAELEVQRAWAHERSLWDSYQEEYGWAVQLNLPIAELAAAERDLGRLRKELDGVLQQLGKIEIAGGGGLGTAVLREPSAQLEPVSPRLKLVVFLSVVAGLCGGCAVVYLQDLLDDHFRSPEELQTQLGFPVLTMVRKLTPLADHGMEAIQVHVRPTAVESEAFRTLRTALALAGDGAERLVVSSSEPGDGKTTIISNLATVYAQSGKRTLLIDADMRRPGLTPLLDLKGPKGLSTVLRDRTPVGESAEENLHASLIENLDVIPSGPRPVNPTELLAGDRFSELLAWAETQYDQILIDSPPALVSDTAIIGRLVDGVLLTVRPEKNGRRVVMRAAESFPALGIKVLGIVVNHLGSEDAEGYYGYSYGYGYGYGYSYGHEDEASEDDVGEELIQPCRKDAYRAA